MTASLALALSHAAIWLPVATVVAVAMDVWAGLIHGLVWHGALWGLHRSHHEPRRGRFEANDALALVHAPIAVGLILYGCRGAEGWGREVLFGVGIGMTLFAVLYVVVHDGLVHQRLPVRGLLRFAALRRVKNAHAVHHQASHLGGAPFSLFFGPWELRARARARRRLTPRSSL